MSVHYHVKVFKVGLLLMLFHGALWAVESIHNHPLGGTFNGESLNKYEYETKGDSFLQSCAWEDSDKPEYPEAGGITIPYDLNKIINLIIKEIMPDVADIDGFVRT